MKCHWSANTAHRAAAHVARAAAVTLVMGLAAIAPSHAQTALPLETLKLPPGFSIEVVARIPSARQMTWGAEGTLFVGSTAGAVHALKLPPPGTKSAPAKSSSRPADDAPAAAFTRSNHSPDRSRRSGATDYIV